jgi:hypothetical protein
MGVHAPEGEDTMSVVIPSFALVTDQNPDEDTLEGSMRRLRELQELWTGNHNQRERWQALQHIADGGALSILEGMPAEDPQHFADKPKMVADILGQILERMASLYSADPAREMSQAGEDDWAQAALWDFGDGLSCVLYDADRLAHLMGTVVARCEYAIQDEPLDVPGIMRGEVEVDTSRDGIRVELFTRDRYIALSHPDDGRFASAHLLHIATNVVQAQGGVEYQDVFHFYDRHHFARVWWDRAPSGRIVGAMVGVDPHRSHDGWQNIEDVQFIPLDYAPPIVPLRLSRAEHSYEVDGILGPEDDLLETIAGLERYFTELMWTALLQRGQPYAIGDIQSWLMSPNSPIVLEEGGLFGIEANSANLSGMVATVEFLLGLLANSLSLPADTFRIVQSDSSLALQFNTGAIRQRLERHKKQTARWERDIHRVAAARYNAARGTAHTGAVRIEHRPLTPALSQADRVALASFEHEKGLASDVEIKRLLSPGLSVREAQASVDAGKADKAGRVAQAALIAGHAQDMEGAEDDDEAPDMDESRGDAESGDDAN